MNFLISYKGSSYRIILEKSEDYQLLVLDLLEEAFKKLVSDEKGKVSEYYLSFENGIPIDNETILNFANNTKIYLEPNTNSILSNFSRKELNSNENNSNSLELQIEKRLRVLQSLEGSQLNTSRNSRSSEKKKIPLIINNDQTLKGFKVVDENDSISTSVWQELKLIQLQSPKIDYDEEQKIHPFINSILNIIAVCAEKEKKKINKFFHEYNAECCEGRPDWIFTQPAEKLYCSENICFFMEAKQVGTTFKSGSRVGKIAKSSDVLFREGIAQVTKRLVTRFENSNRKTNVGIGVVTNGDQLLIIRIDFQLDDNTELFPLFSTTQESLMNELDKDYPPLGLRWLITLLLENDTKVFGLPPLPEVFSVPGEFQFNSTLGTGGFGIVYNVMRFGEEYAFKMIRNNYDITIFKEDKGLFLKEYKIINLLISNNIANVPTYAEYIDSPSTGLLLAPVGIPLQEYLMSDSIDNNIIAERVIKEIYAALTLIHDLNILHCDIRPSNIIVYDHKPVLIDWGLAVETIAKSFKKSCMFGVPEFMSDEKLNIYYQSPNTEWNPTKQHDMHALLYTYAAILSNKDTSPPWGIFDFVTLEKFINDRKKWMKENIERENIPLSLQVEFDVISTIMIL